MKTIDKHNPKLASKKQESRPMLPDGLSNFDELVTHRNLRGDAFLFVDKSLFIRDFLNAGDEATLITRPRRFGKTLILSMLQHFFAPEVIGKKTKGLFDGLKISRYPEIMKYQGQYPVIFLTLKDAKGKTYEEISGMIKSQIRELYETHFYLLSSDKLFPDQKKDFQEILDEKMQDDDYKESLYMLSKYLYQHTGKQVYILLDEYDTPIKNAYLNGCYEACYSFLAALLGQAFKGNNFLAKGLITGILKVANTSLFSGLNNLSVYTMLDDPCYMPYFGFTEAETNDLLNRAKLPHKAHELKAMYNGYNIGGCTLYNPFSIISLVSDLVLLGETSIQDALQPYWINIGGIHVISYLIENNLVELQEGIAALLDGKPLQTTIDENIIFDPQLTYDTISFWSILLLSGYVKSVESIEDEYGDTIHTLSFPNEEVRISMRKVLLDVSFGIKYRLRTPDMKPLIQGDVAYFVSFVKDYLMTTMSYFDLHKQKKEKSYQLLMLGMVAYFANTHRARVNMKGGNGRYDISLTPKNKARKGIIIELKVAEEGADLKQAAQKAFQQITDKGYKADMEARGVTDYVLLGMAFNGKEIEAVYV